MSEVMTDRRQAPRYALILVTEVTEMASGAVLTARSSDVSRSGCYIDTLNPSPMGTDVKVKLRNGDEIFETPARVVYVCPGLGMGVHWGTTAPDKQLALLDRWLQQAARDTR
jgi:Ribonuclease G/E